MPYRVDFNKPTFLGNELAYIQEAIANRHISGDGPFTRKAQDLLQTTLGVPRVLLTTSCTHALEMAAFLLDIQPGDEVIIPSFTFVSTVNAFVIRGARPVFADIRPDTLNLDETRLEGLITPRTRAIVPVHYAGVACEMDAILALSARRGLWVVEDNAHGLFGKYKGRCIADLPGDYLRWFVREGVPKNEIGRLINLMHEIDHNGLSDLLTPLRAQRH